MWGKELKSIRVLLFGVIVGIMAVLFISIPVFVYSMSSRPPVIPEWLEDGDYLQESYLDNSKILVKDKKSNVKGYLQRSYIDQRKMLIFDKDGKVKGYLQPDLLDSSKLKFVKE